MKLVYYGILLGFLCVCAYTDVKQQKILNIVTYSGMVTGLILNYLLYEMNGLKSSAMSMLIALIIFIIPYFIKQMGAGDVKELIMISSITNIYYCVGITITGSFIGGIWALYRFFVKKQKKVNVPLGLFLLIGFIVYQIALCFI